MWCTKAQGENKFMLKRSKLTIIALVLIKTKSLYLLLTSSQLFLPLYISSHLSPPPASSRLFSPLLASSRHFSPLLTSSHIFSLFQSFLTTHTSCFSPFLKKVFCYPSQKTALTSIHFQYLNILSFSSFIS